jgi:hypothetical protein
LLKNPKLGLCNHDLCYQLLLLSAVVVISCYCYQLLLLSAVIVISCCCYQLLLLSAVIVISCCCYQFLSDHIKQIPLCFEMRFKTFIFSATLTPFMQPHKIFYLPILAVKNLIEEQN